jgi:hypothetical protein
MRQLDPGANPLAFFGVQVRKARVRHKMSQMDLGTYCHCDGSTVSRVEGGAEPPPGFAAGCDEAFPEMGTFFTDYLDSNHSWPEGTIPPWFRDWVKKYEANARVIRWWEPQHIPGLLQTPEYAAAIYEDWLRGDPDEIKSSVELRMQRQAILEREDPPPPECWFLIGEDALHNQIGTEAVMAGQLEHLLELSRRPHVNIQIIPRSSQIYAGLSRAAIYIATVGSDDVAQFDNAVQGMTVHDSAIVEAAKHTFDRLRGEALPITASQELIRKVGKQ